MSLAALKALLIGQPTSPGLISPSDHHGYGTLPHQTPQSRRRSSSSTTSTSSTLSPSDLEAQTTAAPANPKSPGSSSSKPQPPPGGFRITARVISDATIGLSDGLTVPFALTAGLSALGNTRVVVFGGLAELIAGAISMGLGGYLGAKSEMYVFPFPFPFPLRCHQMTPLNSGQMTDKNPRASYHETRLQTATRLQSDPAAAERSITAVFAPYSVPPHVVSELTRHLEAAGTEEMVDFLTRFEHCAEEPATSRALTSALTIALAYFLGGLVPLLPYLCVGEEEVMLGLWISVGVMAVALFSFGYAKTCIVAGWEGSRCVRMGLFGGAQMVVVGGAAAGAAMGLVKLFDGMGAS